MPCLGGMQRIPIVSEGWESKERKALASLPLSAAAGQPQHSVLIANHTSYVLYKLHSLLASLSAPNYPPTMSLFLLSLFYLCLFLSLSPFRTHFHVCSPGSALTISRVCVAIAPACILWTLTGSSFSGPEPDASNTADTNSSSSFGPSPHPACPAQLGPETHTQQ